MQKLPQILGIVFILALIWSFVDNADRITWIMEAAPAILGVAILVGTYRKFRFTHLSYIFIFVHCLILLVGAKYTYAEVPLFNWLRDVFDMGRNNYDKIGHFAQGFIPALIIRELLIRLDVLKRKSWTNGLVVSLCLAISAFYELIEWFAAETMGESADSFLGTQGYIWDTQSDMLCALLGALCMVLFLSKKQDAAIRSREAKRMDSRNMWPERGPVPHWD